MSDKEKEEAKEREARRARAREAAIQRAKKLSPGEQRRFERESAADATFADVISERRLA